LNEVFEGIGYPALAQAMREVVLDATVHVPPRQVLDLPEAGKLLVMPATNAQWAMTKVITFVPTNAQRGLPAIQGQVLLQSAQDGRLCMTLDGPRVTARRTAAVSLLAAQTLAPGRRGPLLIIGAGVQGRSHLEAFVQGADVTECWIHSRRTASAQALVEAALALGKPAQVVHDLPAALEQSQFVVTSTSAQTVVARHRPHPQAFVAAVGAFTPHMVEWDAAVCRWAAQVGTLVVDTRDADHEAGDFLQAGLDVAAMPSLAEVLSHGPRWAQRPAPSSELVFFKNCGWAGWDLAAACATAAQTTAPSHPGR
jgi:1-piperideine-2-carboxylate/1-pyrroline-2-carboxylate reductase [NAD(P)H]